jgi:hypothetical protein
LNSLKVKVMKLTSEPICALLSDMLNLFNFLFSYCNQLGCKLPPRPIFLLPHFCCRLWNRLEFVGMPRCSLLCMFCLRAETLLTLKVHGKLDLGAEICDY